MKKKVDLIISKDSANQFLKLYCEAHEKLYEAFMENTKLASNGLYNKIRMKFSPYYPTEKHYNNELILDDDINFNCLPKRLVQRDMNAMGDLITTKKMFSFISPGLSNFEAEDLGFNKVVTVSKDPYKQVFGYEYYTEKAMNFFYELQSRKAAIKVNEACYFAVTMIPLKKYYKELFKKEIDIRNKQLRKIELVKRSREKGRKKIENVGYVYVLKSIGYPGLYKIGSTYGLVEERAEELSGTNVPDPWMPAGKIKLKNAEYYEKQIHKLLKDSRYRKGREFFKVDLSKIKDCFKKVSELSDKGEKKLTISDLKKGIKI